MATVFPPAGKELDPSGYAPALDAIAPGIADYINKMRGNSEYWYDALERFMPSLALTDAQRTLLSAQIHNARMQTPPPTPTQAVNPPIDLAKAASVLTIGSVIYNFLKG